MLQPRNDPDLQDLPEREEFDIEDDRLGHRKNQNKMFGNFIKIYFKLKGCEVPHIGIVLAVCSSLMFSLCSLVVKMLCDVPAAELATFRFAGLFLLVLPYVIRRGDNCFPKKKWFLLVLRGIFGAVALLLQFYAFQHLPLGDASVIIFSSPIFVSLFARIFLKETFNVFQCFLIVLTLIGVVMVTRPSVIFSTSAEAYSKDEWKGAIAAFGSTLMASNVYVLLRLLKDLHYAVVITNFSVTALFITLPVSILSVDMCLPCGYKRWMIIGLIFLSLLGQILKTKALQIEEASLVAIARTSDVVFAFIWQLIFYGEIPDLLKIVGTLIIMGCVTGAGIQKCLNKKTEPPYRVWFRPSRRQ